MATVEEKGPFAAVDSGTLLVIDPCYLSEMLNLTPEQQADWNSVWMKASEKASRKGIVSIPLPGFAEGLILAVGDDGFYSKERIAAFLLKNKEA